MPLFEEYQINPLECAGSELRDLLGKFSFHTCGFRHETGEDKELTVKTVKNCPTRDKFNLGCAHPAFGFREHPINFIKLTIVRFEEDGLLTEEEVRILSKKVDVLHDRIFALDTLMRNSQYWRMEEFPDWKNNSLQAPRNDLALCLQVIGNLPKESLLKGIFEKLFDAFKVQKDPAGVLNSYIEDYPAFKIRILTAQTIVGADLVTICRQLAQICEYTIDPNIKFSYRTEMKNANLLAKPFVFPN